MTRAPAFRALALSTLLLASALDSSAAAAQDLTGTRSLAMGGTLRAAPAGDSAILLNPAGMSLNQSYQITGSYLYRASDAGSLMNVSIVDSVTSRLAAGLSYAFEHATPRRTLALSGAGPFTLEETQTTHEIALAFAYPLGRLFHLGLTTKYVDLSIDQPEGTPEAVRTGGADGLTMDVGAVLNPFSSLNIAVVGYNLVGIDEEFYPRLLGMGVSYALGLTFLAEFDAVLNFTAADEVKASYHGGAELFLGGSYALRGGVMHDTLRQSTYASGGLGLISNKVALDLSLRQMVSGGAETTFAASLRVFFAGGGE